MMSAHGHQRNNRRFRLVTGSGAIALFWVLVAVVPGLEGAPQQGTLPWKPASGTEDTYAGNEMCVMCHVDIGTAFEQKQHAGAGAGVDHPAGDLTCESCHGPGMPHVNTGGDPEEMVGFAEKSTAEAVRACLVCHAGSSRHARYAASAHAAGDLSCTACHSIHSPSVTDGLMASESPALCFTCHQDMKAGLAVADGHGLGRGLVSCESCHNPHGSAEPAMLARPMMNGELCTACHVDKRGPFVYDHPVRTVEGCVACHMPHGSANRFMLKTNTARELCISCHVDVPMFHNMADARYRNCTTCHTAIHGSDSHRLFFRR